MLFNSLNFALFLPLVFALYWLLSRNMRAQNVLLLVASYYFYACWDWRFLFLLMFSTLLDYVTGIQMERAGSKSGKTFWFWLSVGINLGFLGIFKYYNFFVDSAADVLQGLGFEPHFATLQLILPVGISFYTFHGLSYVIDIYKDRIKAERNFVDYAVFVSFFPLLVAGPIERATHLLPQIQTKRQFNYSQAIDGLRQILWGLFKKMVIADNCATYVNTVFADSGDMSAGSHIVAMIFFSLQIYGDFSGYSDIALGTARLFGIELLRNFSYPFFSRDIAEFWRRWHISLSTWFRDYLYIPLGGSRGGMWMKVRNTFIIFLVSGFWHGANWTFIVWGFLNALYIMPSIVFGTNRNNLETVAQGRMWPSGREVGQILLTFSLTVIAFTVFRAANMTEFFQFMGDTFTAGSFRPTGIRNEVVWLILFFVVMEWLGRENKFALERFGLSWKRPLRWGFYLVLALVTLYFKVPEDIQFIYFQF